MGEELNVSIRQEKLLSAMGIQVWHRRGVAAPTNPTPNEPGSGVQTKEDRVELPPKPMLRLKTEVEAQEREQLEAQEVLGQTSIEFIWWRGQHGLMLLEPMQSLDEKLKHDIVAAMDWRVSGMVGKNHSGHFRWPQLAASSGNPTRAMAAFFEANGPSQLLWLLISDSLRTDLTPLLPKDVPLHVLPDSLHVAQQKKELWQVLGR